MRKHPKKSGRKSAANNTCKPQAKRNKPATPGGASRTPTAGDGGGFLSLFLARLGWDELENLRQRKHAAGRPTRVLTRGQLLAAVVFHHTVRWAGSFGENLFCLFGKSMAESTLSERRQAVPFAVFAELLRRALRPVTAAAPEAFFGRWRLAAIDGITFSLANTPAVQPRCKKGGNQKGRAAFAKLQCSALVELALHNPLAARVGCAGESEWKLSLGLLDHLPESCLLLTDRLYGCGAFLSAAMARLKPRNGHFLARVKTGLKVVRQWERFADGSRLVEIKALDPQNHHRMAGTLQVREICATLQRPGFRAVALRLWTSLGCAEASAEELVRLYAARWEQELYFRELKWALGINNLLRSQTPETAAQEVAAMIIGSSLIAQERAQLKPGEELSRRVSFIKTWETLEPLWLTLLLGGDLLSETQKQQLCDRFYEFAARRLMPRKRSRSCPRALRQPVLPWPRRKNQLSVEAPVQITICFHP